MIVMPAGRLVTGSTVVLSSVAGSRSHWATAPSGRCATRASCAVGKGSVRAIRRSGRRCPYAPERRHIAADWTCHTPPMDLAFVGWIVVGLLAGVISGIIAGGRDRRGWMPSLAIGLSPPS